MNDLEELILEGVCKVHKEYAYVSDGWWLYHAPESFIQSHLASHIAHKGGFCVFPECSPKRWKASIDENNGVKPIGRPFRKHDKKRFDLVIWRKKVERPRAILEIKRAVSTGPLLEDVRKILKYKNEAQSYGIRTAYILVYSEAKRGKTKKITGKPTLERRFVEWVTELNKICKNKAKALCVSWETHEPRGQHEESRWAWGVALYRLKYARNEKSKRTASRQLSLVRSRKAA